MPGHDKNWFPKNLHSKVTAGKARRAASAVGLLVLAALAGSLSIECRAQQKRQYAPMVQHHIMNASRFLKTQQYEEARRELSEAVRLEPNCPEAYNNIGISYFRQRKLSEAEANFRQALNGDPLYMDGLVNLALCLYEQGESHYDEAILYFRQALQLSQNRDPQLHKGLADVLRDRGDYQEALKHYSEAVRLRPDYAPTYNGLAMLYYRVKQYDQAVTELQKAIKLKPDYALAYFHLGMVEAARKHVPEAIQAYETSLKYETDPQDAADTRQKIAELQSDVVPAPSASHMLELIKQNQWDKAKLEVEALIAKPGGETAQNYNNLGYILARRGHFERAVEAYNKAISLKKGRIPVAHYNLGQALRLLGDKEGAEREFKIAIQDAKALNKPLPAAYNALGLLLKSRGDLKGADKNYRMALLQAGTSLPVVHYNLAILLEKTEKTREAVQEYKQYLSLAPNGVSAKQAKQRLRRLTGERIQ
ncbi:MAG TPA: tetratricopeptide repeat protein [Candidatus Obscuribacterales bacterium]